MQKEAEIALDLAKVKTEQKRTVKQAKQVYWSEDLSVNCLNFMTRPRAYIFVVYEALLGFRYCSGLLHIEMQFMLNIYLGFGPNTKSYVTL